MIKNNDFEFSINGGAKELINEVDSDGLSEKKMKEFAKNNYGTYGYSDSKAWYISGALVWFTNNNGQYTYYEMIYLINGINNKYQLYKYNLGSSDLRTGETKLSTSYSNIY